MFVWTSALVRTAQVPRVRDQDRWSAGTKQAVARRDLLGLSPPPLFPRTSIGIRSTQLRLLGNGLAGHHLATCVLLAKGHHQGVLVERSQFQSLESLGERLGSITQ